MYIIVTILLLSTARVGHGSGFSLGGGSLSSVNSPLGIGPLQHEPYLLRGLRDQPTLTRAPGQSGSQVHVHACTILVHVHVMFACNTCVAIQCACTCMYHTSKSTSTCTCYVCMQYMCGYIYTYMYWVCYKQYRMFTRTVLLQFLRFKHSQPNLPSTLPQLTNLTGVMQIRSVSLQQRVPST